MTCWRHWREGRVAVVAGSSWCENGRGFPLQDWGNVLPGMPSRLLVCGLTHCVSQGPRGREQVVRLAALAGSWLSGSWSNWARQDWTALSWAAAKGWVRSGRRTIKQQEPTGLEVWDGWQSFEKRPLLPLHGLEFGFNVLSGPKGQTEHTEALMGAGKSTVAEPNWGGAG